MYRKSKVQSTY